MSPVKDTRPFTDAEVPAVIESLLHDKEFLGFIARFRFPVLSKFLPGLLRWGVARVLRSQVGRVTTIAGFQQIVSTYARKLVKDTMTSFDFSGIEKLSKQSAYLFVGNHRDIAGDSMLVDYALYLSGYDTVRIAVGDNLVQKDFATHLMKLNKSFFIKRSEEGAKKIYAGLLESSRYIHDCISQGESIWIAQAEGRAKDGMDLTDPAIIKMFALAERKNTLPEILQKLHIVPVSISYEYDPCDAMKAKELYSLRTEGCYRKDEGEDLLSLVKGLGEFKGRVILTIGDMLKPEFETADAIAAEIDRQVLSNLRLYPVNFWALCCLADDDSIDCDIYRTALQQLQGLEGVKLPDSDDPSVLKARFEECPPEHRRDMLAMYANPVLNKLNHHLIPEFES
ncbi:MAG: 1-acyl-sn-glycerol-3-phosphate acyltransferase [Pseudomonadales bacterium]|nr:1-acyl-sn-glycerol-3-phosphate acyltransferase [Pseudomonadales bacterium]